ncbi:response regulator [Tamlana sp. 62-3]|uniref:histidine kinase n=1 Tax=Neotamlana sargassicola TaxID=2883125 RepID=A0A9X1I3W7_9FLAO|nr:hybrid sensor histidine kinase/response regulator transcription factor [Tamlana sargassicola]MCB4807068.1 response regulator [Tamlana sargassicola]
MNNLQRLLILLTINLNLSWAQNTYQNFNFVSIKEGIPKAGVTDIIQDHNDFIWIATNSTGLYKFNGIDYIPYKHVLNDSTSLSSSRVSCSFIDSDKKLWVGTENGLNVYNNKQDNFNRIVLNTNNPNKDIISSITQDTSNNLYVGTVGYGIYKVNTSTFNVTKIANSTYYKQSKKLKINSLSHAGNNKIYVATNFGLKEIDVTSNKLIDIENASENLEDFKNEISKLFVDANQNLWVGFQSGKGIYKCILNEHKNIAKVISINCTQNKIMSIAQLPDNSIIIGTENDGFIHLNKNNSVIKHLKSSSKNNNILHNSIWKLFIDKNDRIWMGYYNSGVAISDKLFDKFKDITSIPNNNNSLKTNSVMGIVNDSNNNLWIATDGGGIDIYNTLTKKIKHINTTDTNYYSGLTSNYIISIFKDSQNNIWAGSWDKGVFFLGKDSKKFINYNKENSGLKSNIIMNFSEDTNGNINIGTFYSGIHIFNPKTKEIVNFEPDAFIKHGISSANILKIFLDSDNNQWLATTDGLFKVERNGSSIKQVLALSEKINKVFNNSIDANYVLSLFEDSKQNIWIGTRGAGICLYNKTNNTFKWYNKSNGLVEENVASIIEDDDHYIWISGNSGLTKINIEKNEFTNYTYNDGLLSNDFNFGAALKDKDGTLYFGNYRGIDYFNPKKLQFNNNVPTLHLTDFKLFNETVTPNQNKSPLTKVIAETDSITLTNTQSVFTIEYAGLNYTRPEKNNYAYYLEGYETTWNDVGQKRSATYTNLDHGNYIFKLKASNNDGVWNQEPLQLHVKILPPWWKTNWAIMGYITLIILSFYLLNRLTQSRIKEKELIKNERLKRQQQDELNKKKIQFFTNISHEFRTPLTLIMNPLKAIIHDTKLNLPEHVKHKHAIINKNTDRLYRLINELMDFRKLEFNKIKVKARKIKLIDFTKNIVGYFEEETKSKNIIISVDADNPDICVWADLEMLEKIIFNLLSNAVKITPSGGVINIDLLATEQPYLLPLVTDKTTVNAVEIIISDSGPGLEKEEVNKIFDRFYQVERQTKSYIGGTGIGLEVVQSFVKLHKGKIKVSSEIGVGTSFKILFPAGNSHFNNDQIVLDETSEYLKKDEFSYVPSVNIQEDIDEIESENKIHTVLIVEDNTELRDYLKLELSSQHKVLVAANGKEGIKIAKEAFPDVIITDVVMPEIDGLEFCKQLKSDLSTSHIPILMLTAKAKIDDRIEGIETGADAYMVKPFNIRLLKLRLSQLITSRQLIFNKYFSVISELPKNTNTPPIDKEFIEKVLNHINENISDPNLNVEALATHLSLSRSQFYRKIKALTNQTATEFLRNIRLQKAKQILELGETNISKVCYATGFSSHSYFTKCFKNHFGVLPTEIKTQYNT